MTLVDICLHRATRCLTGQWLNPLMHVFMFVTLAFGIGFLFFGDTMTLQASVLYMQTQAVSDPFVNLWGVAGIVAVIFNYVGLVIRGKFGLPLMQLSMFSGFYMWLWAAIIYIEAGFFFQFAVAAFPLLLFWIWYAWQWRRRYTHPNDKNYSAFV